MDWNKETQKGLTFGIGAFLIWGSAPIFWKTLAAVSPFELVAHRVIWSALLLAAILTWQKSWSGFRSIFRSRKRVVTILLSTLMIGANWFIFLYSIIADRVIESSLGYFINPLINVLFGFLFFHERFSKVQLFAVFLAGVGVSYLALQSPHFPWISIGLALSFAFYGMLRKIGHIEALPGLAWETIFLAVPGLFYLGYQEKAGLLSFTHLGWQNDLLLFGTGVITATPLLLYGLAVRQIPFSTIGFLQYIAPTGMFFLSVFMFGEKFTIAYQVAFSCIWLALLIYSFSSFHESRVKNKAKEESDFTPVMD